jgi:hypothetical protein
MTARPLTLHGVGPAGAFVVKGQVARTLSALIDAGSAGVTSLEVAGWGYRLAAYCHNLRKCGLNIETVREAHEDGWHGRYVLRSPVTLSGRD